MNKKKISALILSCAISSQVILPTLNASATELNNTNNKTIENSTSKQVTSNLERKTTENNSKKVTKEKIKLEKTKSNNDLRADEIVNIPDQNLKKALNEELHQSENNNITKKQLASLISLELSNKNISNLEGLQYCNNLTDLDISFNTISNIESLKYLVKLINLNLDDNQLTDINPLKDLTNLRSLILTNNKINDISPLKNLTNLQIIKLNAQRITPNPIQILNDSIEFNNIVKGVNNEFISPNNISKNGIYDINSNKIKWTDSYKPNEVYYSFDHQVTIGNATTIFSGRVTIKVDNKINEKPVIHAENKTIKVGSKFNLMDGVSATDKEDGNITNKIKVVESTVNLSKPGTYKVVYEVTDNHDEKTRKTITVTVVNNDKPVISGINNVTIKEGTTFDPMAGVTATDTEDGNITKNLKVEGKVDTNKAGKYELTYTITDTDGNTTTVKRAVTVIANTENINEKPVIYAENKTIKVGSKFNLMDGVSATDKEDGNITNKIKVVESTVNLSKPGTYKVVYEVTDSQDTKTRKIIIVTVVSDNKPISNESNDTTNNNKPTTNESTSTSNDKVTLPATGATSSLPLIGSILVGLGGLFVSKKNNSKE